MTSRPRGGFTLLEGAIVVLIIGLPTALLIPALQSGRGPALGRVCASYLHSSGKAMNAYADAHGCLPPGIIAYDPCRATSAMADGGPTDEELERLDEASR